MEDPFTILFQSEEDMDLHDRLVNAYGVRRRFCKPGRLDGDAARGHGDPGCCYEKEKSTMKYCMNVFEGIEKKKLYPLLRTQGFEGTFNNPEIAFDPEAMKLMNEMAKHAGLFQENVHSSILNCQTLWLEEHKGEEFLETLLGNVDTCRALDVSLMVVHVQTNRGSIPTENISIGMRRLERLVAHAKASEVRLAFENCNTADLLYIVLDYFDDPDIGYCYDSGHEAYLTPGERFLPKLGHRLFCTHLNDNDGKKDMHWLPFDGVGDFYRTCQELKDCGYKGNLTLEVACRERYKAIYTDEEYIAKCYEAAEKIHSLVYG